MQVLVFAPLSKRQGAKIFPVSDAGNQLADPVWFTVLWSLGFSHSKSMYHHSGSWKIKSRYFGSLCYSSSYQLHECRFTNQDTAGDFNLTLGPVVASWSSGRVQDSGLRSRSSPEFNTLPVRLLVVPLSKALHTALLLSTQEQSGYLWGQICKPWRQVACERLYTPQGVEMDIKMDMECKGPMTREGTCQSLQSRALSLDVDSKQWLYFTLIATEIDLAGW